VALAALKANLEDTLPCLMVYFPLIVKEALMIEPTETESKATVNAFADALIQTAQEAREQPELLKEAPHNAPVKRLDEVRAARELILCRC
jgi:glycine dehydrogenase subunit 2